MMSWFSVGFSDQRMAEPRPYPKAEEVPEELVSLLSFDVPLTDATGLARAAGLGDRFRPRRWAIG